MLRVRGFSGHLLSVSLLSLFLFLSPGVTGEVSAQETPPKPEVRGEGVTEAEAALNAALSEAEKDGRLVFLHTGADW